MMIFVYRFITLFLLLLVSSHAFSSKADTRLEKQMANYWEARLQLSPLLASTTGDSRFNHLLDDLSDKTFETRIRDLDKAIQLLASIDVDQLNDANQINYKVFSWIINHERKGFDYPWHYITFTTFSGWHTAFAQRVAVTTFNSEKNYRDYIKRLKQFGRYADQNMALMQRGIDVGYVQPCEPLIGYKNTISGYITDKPENSTFYTPFSRIPDKYGEETINQLQSEARRAIIEIVTPAYQRYLHFFTETYQPACRQSIGLSAVPQGRDLYEYFVRYHTSLETNAEAVHTLGLSEVKRIRKEMNHIIESLSFKGDFKDFLTFLRTDPQFYPKDADSYLDRAAIITKRIDGKLPEYFSYLPRITYGVLPIHDAIAPKMTVGYAQGATADRTRAGQFRLNTYNLKSRPLYGLTSLTLHEAMPGHILQYAIQHEMESLPNIRRYSGFNAYSEGWALYSEKLGEEMGVYKTPYDSFGRLVYEMWRACRLVVDSGIHSKGWTRQQAIDFMVDNTALSLHNITSEVDRYITWPGQALAYKYGELKILELRERAERTLGSAFSLRDFHAEILTNGPVPLTVLDTAVSDWINNVDK